MNAVRKVMARALGLALLTGGGLFAKTTLAQEASPPFFHDPVLTSYWQQALAADPMLQQQEALVKASQQQARAAQALPDPQLSGGLRNVGVGRITLGQEGMEGAMSGSSVALQQNYPHPQKLQLKQQVADLEVALQDLRVQNVRAQMRQTLQQGYFKALTARQNQQVLKAMAHWYVVLQQVVETRYLVGKVPQQDVWQVKLRRSELERQQLQSAQEEALQWQALRQSLGWPQDFTVPRTGDYPPLPTFVPSTEVPEQVWAAHPMWQQQRLQMQKAELAVKQAAAERESDYFLAGGVTFRGTQEMIWEARAGMSLPVYNTQKNEPLIAAARARWQAQQAETETLKQRLRRQWQEAQTRWQFAQKQQDILQRQLLPEARSSFEAALAAYQGGQRDVAQVIESITRWLSYQQQVLMLREQSYLALNDLEYLLAGEPNP